MRNRLYPTLKSLYKMLIKQHGVKCVSRSDQTIIVEDELSFRGATLYWIENGVIKSHWSI